MQVQLPVMAFTSVLILNIEAVPCLQSAKTFEFKSIEGKVGSKTLECLCLSQQTSKGS
jgi:hypothetical protein